METVASADLTCVLWVQEHLRAAWLNPVMVFVTNLNKSKWFWLAVACGYGVLVARAPREGRARLVFLALLFAAMVGASDFATSGIAKKLIHRRRPFLEHTEVHALVGAGPWSFPSGHATNAFACATFVTLALRTWFAGAIAFTVALLAASSRLYLGVHYPTDLIAGAAVGSLFAAVFWRARIFFESRYWQLAPRATGAPSSDS